MRFVIVEQPISSIGLGLTVSGFYHSITDKDVRSFIDPTVLSVLDSVAGGQVEGIDLRLVAQTLVDFESVLKTSEGRQTVFGLLSSQKKSELEDRVGLSTGKPSDWSDSDVRQLCGFFGLIEERLPSSAAQPSTTIRPNYGLFDHQRHAVYRLIEHLEDGDRRAILHFPTGVGKTRTAMHIVARILNNNEPSVVVWLASGQELLEQAVESFTIAWSHLGSRPVHLGTLWGDHTPNLDQFCDGFLVIGLAKAWSLVSKTDSDWALKLSKRVRLVVFDEAHQSIASTYQQITEDLTLDFRCSLLGLTATPGRTWADIDADGRLADYYSRNKVTLEVPGKNPIEYLVAAGYLARPKFRTLLSKPGLEGTSIN